MTARMSERRRMSFLKALEACGNQTLAAGRACVSRSWVCQERVRNPEFDEACKRAIASARARLREAQGNRPPERWGHLDGVELVVRGTGGSGGGRRVQIARARGGQWTAACERRLPSARMGCAARFTKRREIVNFVNFSGLPGRWAGQASGRREWLCATRGGLS